MRLIIVRHGKARHDSASGRDFDRELRSRGHRQAAYLVERFRGLEPPLTRIVASRAVRANQTAEIIAVGLSLDLEHDDRLLVDRPVSPVLDLLYESREGACLALVGHNPQLEHLIAVLSGEPLSGTPPLRTGEAVLLEIDPSEPLESGAVLDRIRLDDAG